MYHGQKSNFRWYISTGATINSLLFLMILSTRITAGWTWDDHNCYPGKDHGESNSGRVPNK
ncbi:hypothetical protein D0Y65_028055 [Glycine soja]|uniref:Uncharacterized protein n=1 Tax=Glycine soja TaxID=3848 RepID=A0A445ISD5_GLYSO|nr:hypothetical protein D0Y65_028055 [Glycine soja]